MEEQIKKPLTKEEFAEKWFGKNTGRINLKDEFLSDLDEHDRELLTEFFIHYLAEEYGETVNDVFVKLVVDEFLTSKHQS